MMLWRTSGCSRPHLGGKNLLLAKVRFIHTELKRSKIVTVVSCSLLVRSDEIPCQDAGTPLKVTSMIFRDIHSPTRSPQRFRKVFREIVDFDTTSGPNLKTIRHLRFGGTPLSLHMTMKSWMTRGLSRPGVANKQSARLCMFTLGW